MRPILATHKVRVGLMAGTVLLLTALALTAGNWAGTVSAQTVPTVTPFRPPTYTPVAPPATPKPPEASTDATASEFEPTATALSTPMPLTATLNSADVGVGVVTFMAEMEGVQVDVVSGQQFASPANWQRLTEGLQVSRVGAPLIPVYFSRGYAACFRLPVGAAGFRELRVGYFDPAPTIHRWVMLHTTVADSLACTTRFRWSATFALFAH